MPRYDRTLKTANERFNDYLNERHPNKSKVYEFLKGKLISLDIPDITQREFDVLMMELKRKFPNIF